MPHNPFHDREFLDVLVRVLILIVVGFLAVVLAERKPLRVLRRSSLLARTRSWFWVALLFLVSMFTGGFVSFVLATFVLLQGLSEFARLAGIERRHALLLMLWSQIGLVIAALWQTYFIFLPFGFFILLVLVAVASGRVEGSAVQVTRTLFGYLYIGLPMAYIVYAETVQAWGRNFLIIVGVTVAISDVLAFAVSAAVRAPKVAPAVNPDKTWTGVVGNLLGAALGVGILWSLKPREWTIAAVVVLVIVLALGSVWGDLTEGFIKRELSVRQVGRVLPGFGAILDRVDSLLMALPLAYYALLVTLHLTR